MRRASASIVDELGEVARAGSQSTWPSVRSTTSGDPEEGQLAVEEGGDRDLVRGVEHARAPCRPPRPAARASARHGNASSSGARNSRMSPAARSSGAIGVAARSGYVSAYEIGTRMSG